MCGVEDGGEIVKDRLGAVSVEFQPSEVLEYEFWHQAGLGEKHELQNNNADTKRGLKLLFLMPFNKI